MIIVDCCCSTRLVAPTKKPWKRGKGTTLFVTLQHWIKPIKAIKHLPGPADRIKLKRGNHLCVLGTWKRRGLSHWGYQKWGRQITLYINSCVKSSTCTTRGSGTSNIVWFITILLRALLLDELWISTYLAKNVKSCIKSEIEIRY